jgi:hypothetical protein
MSMPPNEADAVPRESATQEQRKYRVMGIDEDGDIQAFETDSEERARDVYEQMQEDLDDVQFMEAGR